MPAEVRVRVRLALHQRACSDRTNRCNHLAVVPTIFVISLILIVHVVFALRTYACVTSRCCRCLASTLRQPLWTSQNHPQRFRPTAHRRGRRDGLDRYRRTTHSRTQGLGLYPCEPTAHTRHRNLDRSVYLRLRGLQLHAIPIHPVYS